MNTHAHSENLRIRDAVPADADRVAALHADSWRRHYRGAYADSYLDGDVVADRRAVWAPRLAAYGDPGAPRTSATVVAECVEADRDGADGGGQGQGRGHGHSDSEGLAGFVHVVFDDDERWGSLVDNLHIAAARQRSGLGTVLLAHAARAAAEQAATNRLYLWVLEQNSTARSFYVARGGEHVGSAPVSDPGGVPGRLNGTVTKLRIAWPDAAVWRRGFPAE